MRASRHLPVTALLAIIALAGCGTGGGASAEPIVTVTATESAPTVTVTATPASTPAVRATATATKTPAHRAPAAQVRRRLLPNVIGMNLQTAQDRLQAAGFYVLNDKDATGQGRFQVFDRNWVVTRQVPAPGQRISVATLITLYAKKYGE